MTLSHKLARLVVEKNIPVSLLVSSLSSYKRSSLLYPIKRHLESIAKEQSSKETLFVETPFDLSNEALLTIARLTKAEDKEHQITLNKSLLAGFKARYRGKLYDGSAQRIIRKLTA